MSSALPRLAALGCACGLVVSVSLTAATALAQDAAVYKWVDPQGVTHYSDQPPMNTSVEELPIRVRRTDRGAVQARVKATADEQAAAADQASEDTKVAKAAAAERERVMAERKTMCLTAKERIAKYDVAQKLYKPGPNGERVYLTDDESNAERESARRAVDEWCDEEG